MIRWRSRVLGLTVLGVGIAPVLVGRAFAEDVVPETKALPAWDAFADTPYDKLHSDAFAEEVAAARYVHFTAMFLAESPMYGAYGAAGLDTANLVCIQHLKQAPADLPGIDAPAEPFALCVPKGSSDIVFELNRGDMIEVWGEVIPASAGAFGAPPYVLAVRMERAAVPDPVVTQVEPIRRTPLATLQRDRWLRLQGGGALSSYSWSQAVDSGEPVSNIFPGAFTFQAASVGYQVQARAWVPAWPYLGVEGSLVGATYTWDVASLCPQLGGRCTGQDPLRDWVTEGRALLLARYVAPVRASRIWGGVRAGYVNGDIQIVNASDGAVFVRQRSVDALALGVEAGVDIGGRLGLRVDITGSYSPGWVPWRPGEYRLPFWWQVGGVASGEVSYAFMPHAFVALGYQAASRDGDINSSRWSSSDGTFEDKRQSALLSFGAQL